MPRLSELFPLTVDTREVLPPRIFCDRCHLRVPQNRVEVHSLRFRDGDGRIHLDVVATCHACQALLRQRHLVDIRRHRQRNYRWDTPHNRWERIPSSTPRKTPWHWGDTTALLTIILVSLALPQTYQSAGNVLVLCVAASVVRWMVTVFRKLP